MSVFKIKSEENFQAINLLIESKLSTPVIHCAYYSALQLVIHYFYEYCGISEEQANIETIKMGSHNYYLNKFVNEIKKLHQDNAHIFYVFFSNFKRKLYSQY